MKIQLNKITSGSLISFVGKSINGLSQYAILYVLAKFLGPSGVGSFVIGRTIIKLASTLSLFGIDGGLLKLVPELIVKEKYSRLKDAYKFGLTLVTFSSLSIALLLYLISPLIVIHVFNDISLLPVLRIFSICIPLTSLTAVVATVSRGMHKMAMFSLIENIIPNVATVILGYLLLLISAKIDFVIFSVFIGFLFSFLFGLIGNNKEFKTLRHNDGDNSNKLELIKSSIPFMGNGILGLLLLWSDTLLIGIFRTTDDVGLYIAAARVALFSEIILYSVNSVFAPTIAKYYVEGEFQKLRLEYKKTVRWILYLCMPVYVVILIYSDTILSLFGSEFVKGANVIYILSIGQIFNISTGSAGYLLTMTGKQKVEFYNRLTTVSVNVFLNMVLIPKYGITGCAIATSASLMIVNLMRIFENYHYLKIQPFSFKLFYPL